MFADHNFGGFEDEKAAIEAKYNLTAICKANAAPADAARCEILFWASDDTQIDVAVPGYVPILLGADAVRSLSLDMLIHRPDQLGLSESDLNACDRVRPGIRGPRRWGSHGGVGCILARADDRTRRLC